MRNLSPGFSFCALLYCHKEETDMFTLIKSVSRFESRIDASIEKFIYHHKFLGGIIIFIGTPLVILAAVCVCTIIIALPISFMFGWI